MTIGKPECQLIGGDGNVFVLIGNASRALKRVGLPEQASEMTDKCFRAGSYDQVLQIIMEYVEVS